jgi:EAL domain-containing protein (putative c-di-GMP-specific phosphodiesterase class I)
MGIKTIAEAVETQAIRERVKAISVNYVQGYRSAMSVSNVPFMQYPV